MIVVAEIKKSCDRGLDWLAIFSNETGYNQIQVEESFENRLLKGRVDLILSKGDKKVIIDFKRSGSSIPTKKELEDFSSIQVWAYAHHFALSELVGVSYVNLSDLETSLIISRPSAFSFESVQGKHYELLDDSLLTSFLDFLNQSVSKYLDDVSFLANPQSKDVCSFCTAKLFCDRRII